MTGVGGLIEGIVHWHFDVYYLGTILRGMSCVFWEVWFVWCTIVWAGALKPNVEHCVMIQVGLL